MRTATRVLGFAGALALVAGTAASQNNNDAPFNNGGDFYTTFSAPSVGSPTGTSPVDITGDLYWKSHAGSEFYNDVDPSSGLATMTITGYFENVLDEDWSSIPSFLDRTHGPAIQSLVNPGSLEPAFFQLGLTTEITVSMGSPGFDHPCTAYPSLCSPTTSSCHPSGSAWSWVTDVTLTTAIPLAADGTTASDQATTYYIQGGWDSTGGPCGIGTNETNCLISTDETMGDLTGLGISPNDGFQIAGTGPTAWGVATTTEAHIHYDGNILNPVADTLGGGAEVGDLAGGAMNGRFLSIGGGTATLGAEIRDFAGSGIANLGIAGASLTALPNPGLPALGGNLMVLPDGLFTSTSAVWNGVVGPASPWFTSEGLMPATQAPVPATTPTPTTLFIQGATFDLSTFTVNSTNVSSTTLLP